MFFYDLHNYTGKMRATNVNVAYIQNIRISVK